MKKQTILIVPFFFVIIGMMLVYDKASVEFAYKGIKAKISGEGKIGLQQSKRAQPDVQTATTDKSDVRTTLNKPPIFDNFLKESHQKEQSAFPPASLVIAAKDLSTAARRYKGAVGTMYLAALGGAYVPVLPYELMLHKDMLDMASKQNLMRGIPNAPTIPEEATKSLANDICTSIAEADSIVQKASSHYNTKIPEYLYQDILNITDTKLYQYFKTYASTDECEVFQGELKNEWDKKSDNAQKSKRPYGYSVPLHEPVFTPLELEQYLISVRKFDTDIAKILDAVYKKT